MTMNLRKRQKLLIIRYGSQIIPKCITLHKETLETFGYCWFGKLGTIPSKKSIDSVLNEDEPAIILYSRNEAYLCSFSEVCTTEPQEGFPDYYRECLFNKNNFPSIYFKLKTIEPFDIQELNNFYVISSGNTAISTLMRSMTSFIFVSYGQAVSTKTKRIKSAPKESIISNSMNNECKYRINGKCSLKSFVNYQYDCEKPSNCIRQKK